MTTITWQGGASGLWSTPADWTGSRVPGAGDDAIIAAGATVTINSLANAAQITNGGVIAMGTGGTLDIGGNQPLAGLGTIETAGVGLLDVSGTLDLGSGTLTVATGGIGNVLLDTTGTLENGTVNLAGGTIAQAIDATLNAVTWLGTLAVANGSTLNVSGGLQVQAAGGGTGTLVLEGNNMPTNIEVSDTEVWNNETITGSGVISENGTLSTDTLTLGSNETLVNPAGNNGFQLNASSGNHGIVNEGLIEDGDNIGFAFSSFDNAGTLTIGAGAIANPFEEAFSNPGLIEAIGGAGTLTTFYNAVFDGSDMTNYAPDTAQLTGGTWEAGSGATLDLQLSGSIAVDDADLVLNGAAAAIQTWNTALAAWVPVVNTITQVAGTLALVAGANWIASNQLAVTGTVTLAGGTLVAAPLAIGAGGTVSGFGAIAAPVNNGGTITGSGGALAITGAITGTGQLQIAGNAILRLDATPAASQSIVFGSGGELILNAPGTSFANAIVGLNNGDRIEFGNGMTITGASVVSGNTIAVSFNMAGGQPGTYNLTNAGFAAGSDNLFVTGTDLITGDSYIEVQPTAGLLGGLNTSQQLELIYIAYFNRAADGAGLNYWVGQSATLPLTSIANAFAPQLETIALYPFLGTPALNLSTPAAQSGLATFINSVYQNMFGHAADAAGAAYWLGQISSGAVGLGAAALSIANGATGTDATELSNKITVAMDFTTRTQAAGLGLTNIPASFITAARTVLNGVDGTSSNDASVIAGENVTTAYIFSAASGSITSVSAAAMPSSTTSPITISASNSVIDPGVGGYTIQFLASASADTLVLHTGGMDQVSGFDPTTDVLNVSSLLREANVNLNGDVLALSNYLSISDQGGDAFVNFNPSGQGGGGSTVAVLRGLGGVLTGLGQLPGQGSLRIA